MSRKLTVSVHRNGVLVDGPLPNRPVRRMPSGSSGAVYFGDVYPLHVGDYIDLADEGLPKTRCPEFVAAGEPIQYVQQAKRSSGKAAITKWYVESNRFGHYLVFDATEKAAERMAGKLEASALGLIRWGESYRAADDGYHYDWFARLDYSGSGQECLALLEPLLANKKQTTSTSTGKNVAAPATVVVAQPTCDHLPLLEQAYTEIARLVHVEERLGTLQDAQEAAVATAKWAERGRESLQSKLTAAEAELEASRKKEKKAAAELRKAKLAIKELQEQPKSVVASRPAGTSKTTAAAEADLLNKIRTLQEESLTAQDLAEEMEAEVIAVRAKLLEARQTAVAAEAANQDLVSRNQELQGQVRNLQRENDQEQADRQRVASKTRRVGGLEQLLNCAFPRLAFTPESVEELEREFPNPRAVYDVLRRLDREDALPQVRIRDDLFEVREHIATGNPSCADMGRVYTRRLPDGRVSVFVHRKRDDKDQQQFFDRVARRPVNKLMASA